MEASLVHTSGNEQTSNRGRNVVIVLGLMTLAFVAGFTVSGHAKVDDAPLIQMDQTLMARRSKDEDHIVRRPSVHRFQSGLFKNGTSKLRGGDCSLCPPPKVDEDEDWSDSSCAYGASCYPNHYDPHFGDTYEKCQVYFPAATWCGESTTPTPPTPTPPTPPTTTTPAPVRRRRTRRRRETTTPPAPPTTPTPETPRRRSGNTKVVGAYAMATQASDLSEEVCNRGWRILAGAFKSNAHSPPPKMTKGCDNWLVLGGDGVGSFGDFFTANEVVGWMNTYNYDNVDFDLESILDGREPSIFPKIVTLVQEIKKRKPGAKFQITPYGSVGNGYDGNEAFKWLQEAQNHEHFHTIAPMFYGAAENGGGWQMKNPIEEGDTYKKWMHQWFDAPKIPNDKLLIGFTHAWGETTGAEKHKNTPGWLINELQRIVKEKGAQGIYMWNGMNTNFDFYGTCIEDFEENCPVDEPAKPPNGWGCGTSWPGQCNRPCESPDDCNGQMCYDTCK